MPIYWWMRLVPTQLLPKETDLQSAAVADLLLIHSLKQVSLIPNNRKHTKVLYFDRYSYLGCHYNQKHNHKQQ